jgi:hypothetical protein
MRLVIISHKDCRFSDDSPTGVSTDGGFPFQMRAISELFDSTVLMVPCSATGPAPRDMPLTGHQMTIRPLSPPSGEGRWRKLGMMMWLARNSARILREMTRADAVHAPIPGDVGTIGMLFALALRKPLLVRYCGNWLIQTTAAQRYWRWAMETYAGGRNVMLATGGAAEPPSARNPEMKWIFSTSLTNAQIDEYAVYREAPAPPRLRLVMAGRQETKKGTGEVLDAMPAILERFPEATLDVVGEGSALEGFRRQAASLGLGAHVVFHGGVKHSEVMRLMRAADLFCFPTVASEGFPKVVLEALACGLPVVTTKVSVLPQLIGTGCGILLEAATGPAVAEAVLSLLADPERYRAMSSQAVETARQYSLECWRDTIGGWLRAAWGPLRSDA